MKNNKKLALATAAVLLAAILLPTQSLAASINLSTNARPNLLSTQEEVGGINGSLTVNSTSNRLATGMRVNTTGNMTTNKNLNLSDAIMNQATNTSVENASNMASAQAKLALGQASNAAKAPQAHPATPVITAPPTVPTTPPISPHVIGTPRAPSAPPQQVLKLLY